jgi:RNA polymerase sigma-70 factor (ECF subfamily)
MTDREIAQAVDRSRAGDSTAFERLVRAHSASIRGFLLRMVGDFHASQDLAQETFLKAFTSLPNLDSPHRFRSWLFRIAFHVAVDFRRRRDNGSVSLDLLGEHVVVDAREPERLKIEEEDENRERYADVIRALAALPEHYGLPMVLRYLQQRSYYEMSRLLDISLSNVKVRLHRARQMIRRRLAFEERAGLRLEERSSS